MWLASILRNEADVVRKRIDLKYVSIDDLTLDQAVQEIVSSCLDLKADFVVTPNADHVIRLNQDREFKEIYDSARWVFADGITISLLARRMGFRLRQRVCGSDLMPAICKAVAQSDKTVFILGGPEGVAELAGKKLSSKYSGLKIVGSYSPKFGFENDKSELKRMDEMLNTLRPNIVFVGLGSPKQERWIYEHGRKLKVGVLLAVGAAIEFEAGTVARAPKIMRKMGLEWLFRAWTEPRRLGCRYLSNLSFLRFLI